MLDYQALCQAISIHAPREGSDRTSQRACAILRYFYPRSPRGERHAGQLTRRDNLCHFYPRSPRGERRNRPDDYISLLTISIHAPREGSDAGSGDGPAHPQPISIHAPREGSDCSAKAISSSVSVFLSTLPARGATGSRPLRPAGR